MNKTDKIKSLTISFVISIVLIIIAALCAYTLITNIGGLTRDIIGNSNVSSALEQLKTADIALSLPIQIIYLAVFIPFFSFLYFSKHEHILACLLSLLLFIVFFVADIMFTRVNGVPLHTALNVIISILNSGIL